MQQQGYIKSLDGIRGLAIILVLTFHSGLLHFGWMGVQLFFVLSGYLITSILWKEKMESGSLSHKLKRFWVRRSLRIFPLYFLYLLVLGITWLLFDFPDYYPTYAPFLFTYTVNYTRLLPEWLGNPLFTHLWSLSIEEQFYLFFPLLVFLLPARILRFLLVFIILFSPLTRLFLYLFYEARTTAYIAADAVYWNTLSHLDAFFLGGLIPVLALDRRIQKPVRLLVASLVIALAAGIWNYFDYNTGTFFLRDFGYDHDQVENYAHVWRYTLLNLVFASLILVLVSGRDKANPGKFFEQSWLVRIGKVSYGMYIFHWAVFVYLFAGFLRDKGVWMRVLLFLPYLGIVYIMAEISYRFVESRFLLLKNRLFPKKTRSLQAPVENS